MSSRADSRLEVPELVTKLADDTQRVLDEGDNNQEPGGKREAEQRGKVSSVSLKRSSTWRRWGRGVERRWPCSEETEPAAVLTGPSGRWYMRDAVQWTCEVAERMQRRDKEGGSSSSQTVSSRRPASPLGICMSSRRPLAPTPIRTG